MFIYSNSIYDSFSFENELNLNQIKEKIISLLLKTLKKLFFQNCLLFSIMQGNFEINENNFNAFMFNKSFMY